MAGNSVTSSRSETLSRSERPVAERRCIALILALTVILTTGSGCAQTRPIEGPARLGQMVGANGPRVRPDRVVEDSRCPAGVRCIQAGRLIVRATVLGGGWSKQVDLTLGVPVMVADGMLTLVTATVRRVNEAPRPYRFTFNFQGGL
jgi:hypothetical protein